MTPSPACINRGAASLRERTWSRGRTRHEGTWGPADRAGQLARWGRRGRSASAVIVDGQGQRLYPLEWRPHWRSSPSKNKSTRSSTNSTCSCDVWPSSNSNLTNFEPSCVNLPRLRPLKREANDLQQGASMVGESCDLSNQGAIGTFDITPVVNSKSPVCSSRGTIRGRAWRKDRPTRYRCSLCGGAGSVRRAVISSLQ